MTLIVDPDSLNQGTEVTIDTSAKTITLNTSGNLSDDGVTGQALYSFLKEEWRTDATKIPFDFPMVSITPEQFEFVDDWEPANDTTRNLIRTAGWREITSANDVKREYLGAISLGNIDAADTAYYAFSSDVSATNSAFTGTINQGIQTFGDATNGNFDKRSDTLTLYIRVQGKTYDQVTTADIGVSGLSYIAYRFPLSEGNDLNISASDGDIDTLAPYTGMSITYYSSAQSSGSLFTSDLNGGPYNFGITIDANNGSTQQVYEFVQRQLRLTTDIDSDADDKVGQLQDALLEFVGSNLQTLNASNPDGGGTGVAIINSNSNDTNNLTMRDNTETSRTFPFVSAGSINFNTNLQNDSDAIYRMFFTKTESVSVSDLAISGSSGSTASIDSAGGNLPTLAQNDYIIISDATNSVNNGIWQVTDASPTTSQFDATKTDGETVVNETAFSGSIDLNPFGTTDAILVDDNSGSDISGTVSAQSSISFDFDYDGNTQGGRTSGTDADVTIVAIGLDDAQYVVATGTITRATGLNFTLTAALERNYSNPA